MATVKTPDERGHPAAAWIVEARKVLDLSDRQVVAMLGRYDEATLRRAEAHSRSLSRPLWERLKELYLRVAAERGVTLTPPPESLTRRQLPPTEAALVEAIRTLTEAVVALGSELREHRQYHPDLAMVVSQAVEATLQASAGPRSRDER